jgi:hypothetical protein
MINYTTNYIHCEWSVKERHTTTTAILRIAHPPAQSMLTPSIFHTLIPFQLTHNANHIYTRSKSTRTARRVMMGPAGPVGEGAAFVIGVARGVSRIG